jgi:hypothetical protein
MLGLPAAGVLARPEAAAQTAAAGDAATSLRLTSPDAAGEGTARFLDAEQLAALHHLSGILVPASGGRPGASESGVAEFLDFLIGQSGAEEQQLYKLGLDRLNGEARSRYGKRFSELNGPQVEPLLEPLRAGWSYEGPKDSFARFLTTVRQQALTATLNSREWAEAASGRRAAGLNYYWRTID